MAPAGVAGVGRGESDYARRVAGLHVAARPLSPRSSLGLPAGVGRLLLPGGEDAVQEGKARFPRLFSSFPSLEQLDFPLNVFTSLLLSDSLVLDFFVVSLPSPAVVNPVHYLPFSLRPPLSFLSLLYF